MEEILKQIKIIKSPSEWLVAEIEKNWYEIEQGDIKIEDILLVAKNMEEENLKKATDNAILVYKQLLKTTEKQWRRKSNKHMEGH